MNHPEYSEEAFLLPLAKGHMMVAAYLVNGIKLEGRLQAIDEHCLILHPAMKVHGDRQIIYKHAVTAIQELGGKPQELKEDVHPSEDWFLQSLVTSLAHTTMFTLNGYKLQGRLMGFDQHSLFLSNDSPNGGRRQIIYKSGLTTIQGTAGDSES